MSEFREMLADFAADHAMIFDPEEHDEAIVGIDEDGRVVYDFDKLIETIMKVCQCDYQDAYDWYEYNMVRSLPYMGKDAPIIVHKI